MKTSNKKRKLRLITVDNIKYLWSITDSNCDGDDGFMLKIFKDKKLIFKKLLHNQTFTPKNVVDFIKNIS